VTSLRSSGCQVIRHPTQRGDRRRVFLGRDPAGHPLAERRDRGRDRAGGRHRGATRRVTTLPDRSRPAFTTITIEE
jgi:hypothetical protein